jgi:hypothetical protein
VRKWRASGRSAGEYAAGQGLNAGTLLVWSSKLRSERRQERQSGNTETLKFVRARVADREEEVINAGSCGDEGRLEVVLGNGRVVRITGNVSVRALRTVLEVVERGQQC